MDIITVIEYLVVMIAGLYVVGLAIVWMHEIKRNSLHQEMQKQIRFLESLGVSMAVLHAKRYKILEDYRRNAGETERAQKFLLENVLFIGRKNQRNVPLGRGI